MNVPKYALTTTVKESVLRDPLLFGKVAAALNIAPTSLPRFLNNDDSRLTQAGVLETIAQHLKIKDTNKLYSKHTSTKKLICTQQAQP
jgi:hypothetical protein